VAYQLSQSQNHQAVLRGGFGVFYDLADSEAGNLIFSYPFTAFVINSGGAFPLDSATATPPPITAASLSSGTLTAFDPKLKLPYTLEWDVAAEQGLGQQQTISASYIGATGRRLLQTAVIVSPNANIGTANLVTNAGTSNYNALQFQYQRRLSRGLQALASYTWAHSIDTASAGSFGNASNLLVPTISPSANRGSSDFDVRNAFSLGLTYDVPVPNLNKLTNAVLHNWSIENVVQARSAPPINVYSTAFFQLFNAQSAIRPDVVPGQPLYLFGTQCASVYQALAELAQGASCPGGKGLNPTAFIDPPTDPNTGLPLRQGNLGRNALRGFGATQWDFAVHRDFPIHESVKLQFRAEMFNILNHPNFGQPIGDRFNPQFGLSTQMLGRSLASNNLGGGAFNPLYQIGGPRSIQFALKLQF